MAHPLLYPGFKRATWRNGAAAITVVDGFIGVTSPGHFIKVFQAA
jgi:hypothetical protein